MRSAGRKVFIVNSLLILSGGQQYITLPNFTSAHDFHAAFIYNQPISGNKLLCVVYGNNGAAMTSTQCNDFVLGHFQVR
jgi:hypothetical protein